MNKDDSGYPSPIHHVNRAVATGEGIKNFILMRGLKPGDPLPSEQELIDALGVSRSSVREAIRHLKALDIVTVKHGSGTFVGELSMQPLVEALTFRAELFAGADRSTLAEVVSVRQYLDYGAAKMVCEQLSGTEQGKLHELVEQMVEAAEAGKMFTELDYAFHNGLLELAGNGVARQLVSSLWRVHQLVLPQLSADTIASHLVETARSHGDMLDAACRGDREAYEQAVLNHYRPIMEIL